MCGSGGTCVGVAWSCTTNAPCNPPCPTTLLTPQALASGNAFCINQLGLSFFTYDEAAGSYSAKTFNLYLFPAPFEQYDRRFLCQASSIAFLAQQGFDFNKFIHDGIPYMPLQLRDAMLRRVCDDVGVVCVCAELLGVVWGKCTIVQRCVPVRDFISAALCTSRRLYSCSIFNHLFSQASQEQSRDPIVIKTDNDKQFVEGVKTSVREWLSTVCVCYLWFMYTQ